MLKIDPGPNSEAGAAVSTNSSIFLKYWGSMWVGKISARIGHKQLRYFIGRNFYYHTSVYGYSAVPLQDFVDITFITIISLLLTDSRSALIYPVIVCAVLYWSVKRNAIKHIFLWPFIIVLGPFC